jgi:hypothetical protein
VGKLTALTSLELGGCRNVTDMSVAALSDLTAFSEFYLSGCPKVTVGKQALRTASPNLTIID